MRCFNNNTKLEKRLIWFILFLSVAVIALFITLLASTPGATICDNPECVRAATHVLDTVDPTVDPCHDFYNFACGNFLKNAFSFGQPTTLHLLREIMKNRLKEIVVESHDKKNTSGALLLQRKFYKTCVNDTVIDADGDQTLLKLLDDVTGGWPVVKGANWEGTDFNWQNIMIKARKRGLFYSFYFRVEIYTANDSTRMLWIQPPDEKDLFAFHWREQNVELMSEIASDLGATSVDKTREIMYTLHFAEQLNLIVQKHYNKSINNEPSARRQSTIKDLEHRLVKINWLDFLSEIVGYRLKADQMVLFDVDDYFTDFHYLWHQTTRKLQANYIAWAIISSNAHFMTKKIRDKYMKMPTFVNDTKSSLSRSDLCYTTSRDLFKNVAEGEYIRRYTPVSKRKHISSIVKNVKAELKSSLEKAFWIDEQTKPYAMKHLQNITEEIGWTKLVYDVKKFEKLFGYSNLTIKSDKLVDMVRTMTIKVDDRYFHQLNQTDTQEEQNYLHSPKLDVNAFYLKYFDKLILPTPILQGIVFDEHRPHYMNYGSLGSIVGHEFMHGFIEYTEGKLDPEVWWSNKTIKSFGNISQCINDDYDTYLNEIGFKGDNTVLEENIADFFGVHLAYAAYRKFAEENSWDGKVPGVGYTFDQLFWIMTSTYLCYEPKLMEKDESMRIEPIHAISSYRVIGRLRNSPYFAKDFNCPIGSAMNPERKCRLF